MSTITTDTGTRHVAGRLTYPTPPELGTILGPNTLGEYLAVIGQDGPTTLLGYATRDELAAAAETLTGGAAPRSVTEWRSGRP